MSQHILVVEDDAKNRKIMTDLLGHAGYRVETAGDGNDALAMIRSETPDLIFMDVQLPGIDGYAVTRSLRADPAFRKVPIIALTSFALSGEKQRALDAGCDAYMTKPIDIHEILDRAAAFLNPGER